MLSSDPITRNMASLKYDCMYVSDCVCRSEHVYLSTFDLRTLIENSGADFGVCMCVACTVCTNMWTLCIDFVHVQ